jgi:hypothetical protein
MPNDIDTVVASLENLHAADGVNQAYAIVDRLNREGRTSDLLALAEAIEAACNVEGAARLSYEAVADHVEEVLALTPGGDHVAAALALLGKERVRSVQRPRAHELRVRAFASRLAHGQSKDVLLAALTRDANDDREVLSCWMHETVLRGTSLDREEQALAFQARLAADNHPLGALPLTLLEAETEAPTYMPMYGANAISKAVQRLESGPTSTRTMPPPGEHGAPEVTRIEDGALEDRLREAVVPWTTSAGSNGKTEAKVFRLDPPLTKAAPGRWLLRTLPLDCMDGAGELRAERCNADAVWGALFAAASNGGAYSSGLGGAYGRLAAWTSLAALVDAPRGASPHDVDERARACTFLVFGAPADGWWNDIAWDIGALAVRSDGASVAVLAATDAD